ncbi:hypothetical protein Bca4012_032135 [Brassica carinata]
MSARHGLLIPHDFSKRCVYSVPETAFRNPDATTFVLNEVRYMPEIARKLELLREKVVSLNVQVAISKW